MQNLSISGLFQSTSVLSLQPFCCKWQNYFFFFWKKDFFILKAELKRERDKERERQREIKKERFREKSFTYWLAPWVATIYRTGQSKEPGTPPGLHKQGSCFIGFQGALVGNKIRSSTAKTWARAHVERWYHRWQINLRHRNASPSLFFYS